MRPYGVDRGDAGRCCPGHDKFSSECYNSRRSERAKRKATQVAHQRARARAKAAIRRELRET